MQGQTLHIQTQGITMRFKVERTTQTRAQIHLKFVLKLMGKHLQLSYIPNKETVDTSSSIMEPECKKNNVKQPEMLSEQEPAKQAATISEPLVIYSLCSTAKSTGIWHSRKISDLAFPDF